MEKNEKIGLAKELVTNLYQIAKRYEAQCRQQEGELAAQRQALDEKEREQSTLFEENARLRKDNEALQAALSDLAAKKDGELAAQAQRIEHYLKYITDNMEQNLTQSFQDGWERQKGMQETLRGELLQRQTHVEEQLKLLCGFMQMLRKEMLEHLADESADMGQTDLPEKGTALPAAPPLPQAGNPHGFPDAEISEQENRAPAASETSDYPLINCNPD